MKRVIIIGAGPCGLVALKEMLEAGHEALILESQAHLGGVFGSSATYPNLHLTISNWAMAFSDFPDQRRLCYPTAQEYLDYLHDYAQHFGLDKQIKYGCKVTKASLRRHDGRWAIEVKTGEETISMESDALIVATGASQEPKPIPAGLAGFTGRIIHSSEYDDRVKRDVGEKKLKVLVVGTGESGADVSAELGQLSPNVTVWARHWPCVAPRYLTNLDEMAQVEANKYNDIPANGFLEAVTTNRLSAGQNANIYGFFRRVLWSTPILNSTLCRVCLNSTAKAILRNDQAQFITKNSRMLEVLHRKQLRLHVCQSARATGQTIHFEGSNPELEAEEFDLIVNCTGFKVTFPWLETSIDDNPRSWFLHCFPPGLGDRLFFVGYARPHQGGVPAMAEMLSRYIALLLRGERKLPNDYAEQAIREGRIEREYYRLTPNLNVLCDYNSFLESVARRIGCEPKLPWIIILLFNLHLFSVLLFCLQLVVGDPASIRRSLVLVLGSLLVLFIPRQSLITKWWVFPHWPAWYRQRGPGAKPELSYALLDRAPAWKNTAWPPGFWLWLAYSIPLFYVQRVLSVIGFLAETILSMVGLYSLAQRVTALRPKLFVLHGCPSTILDLFTP